MSVNLLLLVASVYKTCTGWLAWLMYGGTLHKLGARLLYFPSVARATLRWRRGKQNWYDRVDETVLLGALPFRSQTKELVEEENVRAVLSYNEWYELQFFTNSKEEWLKHDVAQHWFETVDFQPPLLPTILRGLQIIEECKARGQSVYVHCKAGKGRSAVVAACYLIKSRNLSLPEAIGFLRTKRPHISINKYQKSRIHEFLEQDKAKMD